MTGHTRNVCLMGAALDTGNLGVSALATSLVSLVLEQIPKGQIFIFVGRNEKSPYEVWIGSRQIRIPVINFRLSPIISPREHLFGILLMAIAFRIFPSRRFRKILIGMNPRLRSIAEADFVGDIRGGDSFSDIYGLAGMIIGSLPSVIAILLGKDLVMLPQTYGPYKRKMAKRVARLILRRARVILSRDKEGLQVVADLLGGVPANGRLRYCPDVAFVLESRRPDPVSIQPFLAKENPVPKIGLNVSGLLYNGENIKGNEFGLSFSYRSFVHELTYKILSETDAHLLLVPHSFPPKGSIESDLDACVELFRSLAPRFPDRVHIVTRDCGPSGIKGIIGLCDFFIGSRMHACIAALSQVIPTVGVAYSRKFHGVFESVGVGHLVVDARRGTEKEAIEAIFSAYRRKEQEREVIQQRGAAAQALLRQTFRDLLGGPPLHGAGEPEPDVKNGADLQETQRIGIIGRD